ncbi:helix-turn-helix domain-containing protein [Legionella sp. 31fI33]|uniref:helix-turn-helix domain-containing protein n=1 Tax=Legionella sp. 31fI33 TaxID=2886376 RepID=UPI001E5BCA49|nr:helix-turn-helix transcriptional regulator [Legionella sp. 31fI33]MCC5016052.1 helix-turn-helix domain-containing protein [Legionella sp. 31fI33]
MNKDPWLVKLGDQIREVRKAHGFSQEAIASEAGIDRSYMGGVERGERNIAALNLIKLAKALNVEVGELFPSLESYRK